MYKRHYNEAPVNDGMMSLQLGGPGGFCGESRFQSMSYPTSSLALIQGHSSRYSKPASWDTKIYTLESEARTLRLALEAVENELAFARCARGRIHNATSPSCRIPPEMLAEMMQLAVESCTSPSEEWETLRTISSASHHWRAVALHAPRLWCRVEAHLGRFDAKFRCFLERSRCAPLQITLDVENKVPERTAAKLQAWIEALAPHLERCEKLVIRTRDHCAAQAIFPFRARMPILHTFTWLITDRTQDATPSEWVPPMLVDPELCEPSIFKIVRKGTGHPLPLEWDERTLAGIDQLTLEGWAGFPNQDVVNLVGRCKTLRGLVWIRAVDSDDTSHASQMPVMHSSTVEVLRIDLTIHDEEGSNVLRHMQFPQLRHLTIYSGDAASIPLADEGLGKHLRFPHLETAWLSLFTFSPTRVVEFMDAHPSLRVFGCALRGSFVDFIQLLSEPASVVPWRMRAPQITTIYVICGAYSWDGDRQPQACIDGLCAALRALFSTRRAGAVPFPLKVQLNDRSWRNTDKINFEYCKLQNEFPENIVFSGNEDDPPTMFRHVL